MDLRVEFENKMKQISDLDKIPVILDVDTKEYELAKKQQRPYIAIVKRSKGSHYGGIAYNMSPVAYDLNNNGVQKLKYLVKAFKESNFSCFSQRKYQNDKENKIGSLCGFFGYLRLKECNILAEEIKSILFDEENYTSMKSSIVSSKMHLIK